MVVRSKEQLAVLLKLIEVNNVILTRKNLSVRQKLWQAIAEKLNNMDGAEKDVEGWKRTYQTWRFNVGQDYRKELQKVIEALPDDEYFYINVTEDESEDHVQLPRREGKATAKNPTEKQKTRLHELMTKHREILSSRADDEPLKARMWLNIAEELNAIPRALKLTSRQWQERVDWDKYKVRRGRKPSKKPSPSKAENNIEHENHRITDCQQNVKDIQFDIIDQTSLDSEDASGPEYESIEKLTIEKVNAQGSHSTSNSNSASMKQCLSIKCEEDGDIEMLLNDEFDDFGDSDLVDNIDNISDANDDDESEYKQCAKRLKPAPIVKSFKFSQRIVKSVEKLHSDVCDMKELLQKTTSGLVRLEQVMQQQTKQQKLTNALLKQNGQLLKVLVQYKSDKSGRRTYTAD